MKKILITAVVITQLITILMFFNGCNSKGNTTSTSGKKTEITFMGWATPNEKSIYNMLVEKYQKSNPEVTIKYIVASPEEYTVKLQSLVAGNRAPDIFYLPGGFLWQWAESGQIENLTSYIEKSKLVDVKNTWGKAGIDQYRFDGKELGKGDVYALPKDVGPWATVYNKKIFAECGIPTPDKDKPWTWEDILKYGKMMTKDKDADGKTDQYGFGAYTLESAVWSNGGNWLDETKKKVTVNTPQFIEALQFVADLTSKYKICPTPEDQQSVNSYTRWLNGTIGVFNSGPWDMKAYRDLPFEWDIMPTPASPKTGKSATWLGTMGLAISAKSANKDKAFDFACYISFDPDGQREMYKSGQIVPNLIDMAKGEYLKSDLKPANKEEFIQILEDYGRTYEYYSTYNSEWMAPFNVGLAEVITGRKSAADFCKEVEPQMQKILDNAKS